MRDTGVRFECLRMRPHDHIGWVFSGAEAFDTLALPFLAEGAARRELLMYVSESPSASTAASLLSRFGPAAVRVASVREVYGASGLVNAAAQRATFTSALADAQAAGFSGIRVAADNSALVTDERRLAAWIRWEHVADRFMAERKVTGLCAFDSRRVDVNRLRHLSTLHPLSAASDPSPQFRLFTDGPNLALEGDIDSSAVTQIPVALEVLPPSTGVLIDLLTARLVSRAPLAGLRRLASGGVTIVIQGEDDALKRLIDAGLDPGEHLILRTARRGAAAGPPGSDRRGASSPGRPGS